MSLTATEDGLCSTYSAQPSETNCSINEALSQEINAINEFPDNFEKNTIGDESIYSMPDSETNVTMADKFYPCQDILNNMESQYSNLKSETNVTMSEGFKHCPDVLNAVLSKYSTPKSETNVTMKEEFEPCPDVLNAVMSKYSTPKSETNVTMKEEFEPCPDLQRALFSIYTKQKSETNVTLNEQLSPCKAIKYLNNLELDEKTAISDFWSSSENDNFEFEFVQEQLGILDEKTFGIECLDGSFIRAVDSIECLNNLDHFQPKRVDFESFSKKSKTCSFFNPFMMENAGL